MKLQSIKLPVLITIHLDKLEFFAHHGMHPEESITGGIFDVTVSLSFEPGEKITSITQTVDYTKVYEVIQRNMRQPTDLLEMLAENICDEIYATDNRIHNIYVRINKQHPPIANFIGKVGVSFCKEFL